MQLAEKMQGRLLTLLLPTLPSGLTCPPTDLEFQPNAGPLQSGRPHNQPYEERSNNESDEDADDGKPKFLACDCLACHRPSERPSAWRPIRVSSSMLSLSSNTRICCFKILSFFVSVSFAILRQSSVKAAFMSVLIRRLNYRTKLDRGIRSRLYRRH